MNSERVGVTILGSGSKGNSTLIHCGNEAVMIDAGFSCRECCRRLKTTGLSSLDICGILVSHEHSDHINGLRACSEHFETPIFATRKCAESIRMKDGKIRQIATFAPGGSFSIGNFEISPIPIPHDASEPVAFAVECNDVKIVIATDMGYVTSALSYFTCSSNIIIIESNHDMNMLAASNRPWNVKQRIMGRYGHLSNDATREFLECAVSSCTRNVVLAHISHDCNTPEKARDSGLRALKNINREDISLEVAAQDVPLQTIWANL